MPKIGKKSYDTRIIKRELQNPQFKKDYDKYLKNLPDDAENSAWTRPGEEENKEGPELEVVR